MVAGLELSLDLLRVLARIRRNGTVTITLTRTVALIPLIHQCRRELDIRKIPRGWCTLNREIREIGREKEI